MKVVVEGLNTVCYDFEITEKQVAATEKTGDFLALIGAGDLSKLVTSAEPPTPKAQLAPGAPLPTPPAADFDRIVGHIETAATELLKATPVVNAARQLRNSAKKSLESFYTSACPGGADRGPADLPDRWTQAYVPIKKFLDDSPALATTASDALTNARTRLTSATADLALFRQQAASDAAYKKYLEDNRVRFTNQERLAEAYSRETIAFSAAVDSIRADVKSLGGVDDGMKKTLAQRSRTRSIYVRDDTESIDVTVAASGKAGIATVKDAKISDAFTVPAFRRLRAFLTAGFLFSSLDEHSYQRETLVDTLGNAYSTFVDLKQNDRVAFAPAILTHMTFARAGVFDFAVTGGIAARSVKDRISPDFLVGVSSGLRDRVVLTAAYHMGRVEKLLIGDPEEVRKAGVPDTITRNGAVGDPWRGAFAVTLSYRLP